MKPNIYFLDINVNCTELLVQELNSLSTAATADTTKQQQLIE